jgi:hypothetical protein
LSTRAHLSPALLMGAHGSGSDSDIAGDITFRGGVMARIL